VLETAAESELIQALKAGDETAFTAVVERYHFALVRLALAYVRETSVAEEVAQEAWLAVLQGLDRFEQRSSFQTWLFTILTNQAKTRGRREARSVPWSALAAGSDLEEPAVPEERFRPADASPGPGGWVDPPRPWENAPEQRLLASEARRTILDLIAELPTGQRGVITLRDVEGLSAEEACTVLELTDANQRVLLHRARSKVRQGLERYLNAGVPADAATRRTSSA
jgi:RNA polymerase sigma-70 factor (ECF subfamily)